MQYKDFPKHDLRRLLAVLFAIDRIGEGATLHYISLDLNCTRAEVARAILAAQQQLMVQIEKNGPVYRIKSWGVLDRAAVDNLLSGNTDVPAPSGRVSRENEAELVQMLVSAAIEKRAPRTPKEADLYRFVAELLCTRYNDVSMFMKNAADTYFEKRKINPRSFSAVVQDRMVGNVSRLRNLMEKELAGVSTW